LRTWLSTTTTTDRGLVAPAPEVGLRLVHEAQDTAADLVLVHGLGGSWTKTWSWNRDPQLFWPAWLASDDALSRLRVFSFGYNASLTGPKSSLGILDFAKDLLFAMSGYGDQESKIGEVCCHCLFCVQLQGDLDRTNSTYSPLIRASWLTKALVVETD